MNITIDPELEKFVNKLVEEGKFLSPSETINAALKLLQERYLVYQKRLAQLQQEINIGIEASERGEVFDGEEVFAELEAELDSVSRVAS